MRETEQVSESLNNTSDMPGDGVPLGVRVVVCDGVLLRVGDGVLLCVGDGVLLLIGDGVLFRVGDGDGVLLPVGVRPRASQVGAKCAISSTFEAHPLNLKPALVSENNTESKNELTKLRTADEEAPTTVETVLLEITLSLIESASSI
jgi:hypothetical protein